jgi:hypothetical protein
MRLQTRRRRRRLTNDQAAVSFLDATDPAPAIIRTYGKHRRPMPDDPPPWWIGYVAAGSGARKVGRR